MRLPHISSDADPAARIAMIKKSLFFMRKGCKDWGNESEVGTLTMSLLSGTEGRCPDGQNSFYDEWASEFVLNSAGASLGQGTEYMYIHIYIYIYIYIYAYVYIYIYVNIARWQMPEGPFFCPLVAFGQETFFWSVGDADLCIFGA